MTQLPLEPSPKRPHIYEIDLIRVITVFSVVALHSLAASQFLVSHYPTLLFVNLIIHILHYNRQIFMCLTGLVLTYAYFGKPFSSLNFWKKRTLLIFIPYVFWSALYVFINNDALTIVTFIKTLGVDILTGAASYQLYYILLSLEFYIIFPVFIIFLKWVKKHPVITLGVSFLLQLVWNLFDFTVLQTTLAQTPFVAQVILPYQDRFLLTYQFFFIFGSIIGLYLDQGYTWLKKYGKFIPLFLIPAIIIYSWYYYQVINETNNIFYATSVIQPSVLFYSLIIICFFFLDLNTVGHL